MAIIVDKVQKKKDIAMSCLDLFMQNSISSVTISQVAKTAGIGKGTVYEYFKNKEDIVFEILNILTQKHDIKKQKQLNELKTTRQKVKSFTSFFYARDKDDEILRHFHKEFVSISILTANHDMAEYQKTCFSKYIAWFEEIIQEGIDNGEIIKDSLKLVKGIFAVGDGMLVLNTTQNDTADDLEKDLTDFLDALFDLIEIKH